MASKILDESFTFDDVLIRPAASAMEPAEASLATSIAGINLSVPFLSAAMDRVTEVPMAIALGKLGGLGVLHRNCGIEEQVRMVKEVKAAGVHADDARVKALVAALQGVDIAEAIKKAAVAAPMMAAAPAAGAAPEGKKKDRLDVFLANSVENATRSRIQKLIKFGGVTANGVVVKPNYQVCPNDVIDLTIPTNPRPDETEAEDIPLNIVYEDPYLLVVNKPAGMVAHPSLGN